MNYQLHRSGPSLVADGILPGSKSISNRLLMIRAIAGQDMQIDHLSDADDTHLLQTILQNMHGKNEGSIDVGHAGTDMRFLTAYLACTPGHWQLTGSDRMKQRPIGELVNALRQLGAEISYQGQEGYPPLLIRGKDLPGGTVQVDGGISSQFITALLLVAPLFEHGLQLHISGAVVSRPYIDMTVYFMRGMDIHVEYGPTTITVHPGIYNCPEEIFNESDWSAASYWYSIAALSDQCDIRLRYLFDNSPQGDAVLPEVYRFLGVATQLEDGYIRLINSGERVSNFNYDFTDCPDIAQTVAVTCACLGIPARLEGLKTLRIKETDRILALQNELKKLGTLVMIHDDVIELHPTQLLETPGDKRIATYKDHRMAMSFAPASITHTGIIIEDASVVSKSYPGFWEDLKRAAFQMNEIG